MDSDLVFEIATQRPFERVVKEIERQSQKHQFRVLTIHDVQRTLRDKGFEQGPMKIVEVCSAKFAHQALQADPNIALFMPCKYAVFQEGDTTIVKLGRPTWISKMLPEAGIDQMAEEVEFTLKKIMEAATQLQGSV